MSIVLSVPATATAPALELRPWGPADLTALVVAHRDPMLRQFLSTYLADETAARAWIETQQVGWETGARLSFAIVAEDGVVGHITVKDANRGSGEVGYWTAAAARGQGIAPRAVETVSRWALGEQSVVPAMDHLRLIHAVANTASCRVAEKAGYPLDTVLPPALPDLPNEGHLHVRLAPPPPAETGEGAGGQ